MTATSLAETGDAKIIAQSDGDPTGGICQSSTRSLSHSASRATGQLAICKVEAQGFHGRLKVLLCSPASEVSWIVPRR